jgi:hypothetical protein
MHENSDRQNPVVGPDHAGGLAVRAATPMQPAKNPAAGF